MNGVLNFIDFIVFVKEKRPFLKNGYKVLNTIKIPPEF